MRVAVMLTGFCVLAAALQAQSTTWTSFEDRRGHAMASTAGGGLVMFGGESVSSPGGLLGDTNRLSSNNQTWTQGEDGPTPLAQHAMGATTVGGQPLYLVFGGRRLQGGTPVLSDRTYQYDGSAWGDLTGSMAVSPAARTGHAIATNPVTGTLLMFGGFDGSVARDDVWEFDAVVNQWSQHPTAASRPSPRFGHCMAIHPGNGGADARLYLFGGTPFRSDLWEYNPFNFTWINRTPSVSPPGRRYAALAYLASTDELVLFGGQGSGLSTLSDTWAYDRTANTWAVKSGAVAPEARFEHAMAADNTGNNLILLGGTNAQGDLLEGTWLWNGVAWSQSVPVPAARDGAGMSFDCLRGRHLVFGGQLAASGAETDETWEIDGLNWRRRLPSAKPSPRRDPAVAYHETLQKTILFGGRTTAGGVLGDTWEWNGVNWVLRSSLHAPPPGGGLSMAFDSERHRVWLPNWLSPSSPGVRMWWWDGIDWRGDPSLAPGFTTGAYDAARAEVVIVSGTEDGAAGASHGWSGGLWRRLPATPGPSARSSARMVYDSVRQEVMLFGGHRDNVTLLGDTWIWNGSAWSQRQVQVSPAARAAHYMVFDQGAGVTWMFGGILNFNGTGPYTGANDTWRWDGSGWQQMSPAASPPPRWAGAEAFDPVRGRFVIFGGGVSSPAWAFTDQTWEFDGNTWVLRSPAGAVPPPRYEPRGAFDPLSARFLLHGGYGAGGLLGDTWAWDGTGWTNLQPAVSIGARGSGTAVATPLGVAWFGGVDANGRRHADGWRWNGAAWGLIASDAAPLARTNFGLAYDIRRDKVVMFGGMSANDRASAVYNNETWEWDGGSWTQRAPAVAPSPRGWCRLAYDQARARTVLYGGADSTSVFQDTWEWDGVNWIAVTPVAAPPGSFGHGLSYDAGRAVTIAYGGMGTWDYGPLVYGEASTFGTGCATSASNPPGAPLSVVTLPWSGPWLGDRFDLEFANRPAGLGVFVLGFSATASVFGPLPVSMAAFGSPQCSLRVSPDVTDLILPGSGRYQSFVLPNHPLFLGAVMYAQGGFFDAGNNGAVVTSDGIRLVFGQK